MLKVEERRKEKMRKGWGGRMVMTRTNTARKRNDDERRNVCKCRGIMKSLKGQNNNYITEHSQGRGRRGRG